MLKSVKDLQKHQEEFHHCKIDEDFEIDIDEDDIDCDMEKLVTIQPLSVTEINE